MKHRKLEQMIKGWFIGSFEPSVLQTDVCEVAVKKYQAGEYEGRHYHKIATEVTLVVSGKVQMIDKEWSSGDIIVLEPGEVTDFKSITNSINVVVKIPGAKDDKYNI